ncbi:hypothetical protein [Uliginosibacterium gangwonense]|uniref:hypothetical protein n=1 Tax=Uliginosibacterium gangwonense TaxID=392736 RepID=UPI0003746BFA|nr:hypothetical protein [Uliginosibacterium gangwonense]
MKFLAIVAILVSMLVGAAAGYWAAYHVSLAFDSTEIDFYSSYIATQLEEGADAAKEKAILSHLALIEKRSHHKDEIFNGSVAAFDAAKAYANLYALAKKRGADQEAQTFLDHATSYCPQLAWKECNADKLLEVAKRLDKQGIFNRNENR